MKRLKSLLPLLIAMILTVSIMLGSFGIFAFASGNPAMPEREFFASTIMVDDEEAPVTNVMVTRVKEGGHFTIPVPHDEVEYKVTNPIGLKTPVDESKKDEGIYRVHATMLGNYTVTYYKGDHKYSYNVLCYEDRDYYMQVVETAEDFLPTYVRKGSEITIPTNYSLVYKNSTGKVVEVDNAKTKVSISSDIAKWKNDDKKVIVAEKSGTLVITFEGSLSDETKKKFTKEFTINVQDDFVNEAAPILGQLSVTPTANLNSLYTVPTATANDSYDSRVFIDVEVIGPGDSGKVLAYEANTYGYAEVPTEPAEIAKLKPVAFDNKDVRSFYPTQPGIYTIKYTAYNGGGNVSFNGEQAKKSSGVARSYTFECSDKLAPIFVNVDSDKIPTNWGLNSVSKSNEAGTSSIPADNGFERSTEFVIPFPTFADNADKEEDLTVTITIVNPAIRTLARWEGTVKDYKDGGVDIYSTLTYNDYFFGGEQGNADKPSQRNKKFVVDEALGGMVFSFDYFNLTTDTQDSTTAKIDTDTEKYGNWTINYTVEDTSGNGGSGSSTKRSYTVNLTKNFTDTDGPSVDENNLDIPKYILINSESSTFTVPVIKMNSSSDTDITFNYTMTSEPIGEFTEGAPVISSDDVTYYTAKEYRITRESAANTIGGKSYTVEKIDGNHYVLIAEKGVYTAFVLGKDVEFDFVANDDVGNTFTLSDIETEGIVTAIEKDDETEYRIVINILNADVPFDGDFEFDFDGFEPDAANVDNEGKATQNKVLNLGGFSVSGIEQIDYTGVEVSINDIDGEPVAFSLYTYNLSREVDVSEAGEEPDMQTVYDIYVKGVRVTPKKAGIHTVNVRVYDISGKSIVYGFTFDVKGVKNPGGIVGTATKVQDTGALASEYELDRTHWTDGDPETSVIVRAVSGFSFRIMNNIFTGLESSDYRITDYVVNDFASFDDWTESGLMSFIEKIYTVSISSTEKPVIEFHDVVEKFVASAKTPNNIEEYEEGKFIELPVITGYSKFENATIDVTVSYSGKTVDGGVKKIFYELDENGYAIETEKLFEDEIEDGKEDEYVFSGIFAFAAVADGDYTVKVSAVVSSGDASQSFTIKVGDRTPISFTVDPVTTATVGSEFKRVKPTIESTKYEKVTISLKDPNGKLITDAGLSLTRSEMNNFENYIDSGYKFTDAGPYTITYTVYNENDNSITSIKTFTLDVTGSGSTGSQPPVALTAVLIIVGILLIAGVVVYVIRFRAVKK